MLKTIKIYNGELRMVKEILCEEVTSYMNDMATHHSETSYNTSVLSRVMA